MYAYDCLDETSLLRRGTVRISIGNFIRDTLKSGKKKYMRRLNKNKSNIIIEEHIRAGFPEIAGSIDCTK